MSGMTVGCDGVVHIYTGADRRDVVALRGLDLDVDAGERVALVGPSGSGKSTLLSLLGGLIRPSAGRILIGDQEIGAMTERALLGFRARRVGTVLQGSARNLLPYATPEQNVRFAQRGVPRRLRRGLLAPDRLLAALGLAELSRQRNSALSGGEQQRVALAVGVANQPGLLLADEPTSQLGLEHRARVLDLLDRINAEFGTTIVVVTHDPDVGARLGRTVAMRDGRVGAEGRHGEQYAVVGRDGAVHIPDELADEWPPGTLVRFERDGAAIRLTRRREP